MKNNKEVKISYWAAHLTTIVSVTLVLLIIGIIALISIGAANETRRLREKLEVSVVMADSVSNQVASDAAKVIAAKPYSNTVKTITKEEALKNWKGDTGEDLESLFGVNPLSPEVSFTLSADFAGEKELAKIGNELSQLPGVEAVALPDAAMVKSMNRNIERFALILGAVALVMLVISFVLINNTIHLSIYARRFTIHTMQLVGATNGFIRAPYIGNNMLSGLISGIVASAILALVLLLAPNAGFGDVSEMLGWEMFAVVAGCLMLAGVVLCGLAALLATTRYLRKNYDDLFRN